MKSTDTFFLKSDLSDNPCIKKKGNKKRKNRKCDRRADMLEI